MVYSALPPLGGHGRGDTESRFQESAQLHVRSVSDKWLDVSKRCGKQPRRSVPWGSPIGAAEVDKIGERDFDA